MLATSDLHQMGIATIPPTLSGIALVELLPLQIHSVGQQAQISFSFPDFQTSQIFPLVDFRYENKANLVRIKFLIDKDALGVLELHGHLIENGSQFKTDEYFFETELVKQTPRADFISSTFKALLGLSSETHLKMSEIGLDGKFKFVFELYQISKMLQLRQIAYRLMVIEQAIGKSFQLPQDLSLPEQEIITFIYRAIVERSFLQPIESFHIPLIANEECVNWFKNFLSQSPMTLTREDSIRNLFGEKINLGQETVTIIEGVVENADKVEQELALNDGHKVLVEIRSLIGQVKIELPFAHCLPLSVWDSSIQSLIDLESQLDSQLARLYNDLAAATLAGLTEEEIAEVTARPELNFGISDNEDGE